MRACVIHGCGQDVPVDLSDRRRICDGCAALQVDCRCGCGAVGAKYSLDGRYRLVLHRCTTRLAEQEATTEGVSV